MTKITRNQHDLRHQRTSEKQEKTLRDGEITRLRDRDKNKTRKGDLVLRGGPAPAADFRGGGSWGGGCRVIILIFDRFLADIKFIKNRTPPKTSQNLKNKPLERQNHDFDLIFGHMWLRFLM